MAEKNPFSISFGRLPAEYVTREEQYENIVATFTEEPVTDQIYVITGIRGTGKTVLLSAVMNHLEQENDWIVIGLNAMEDMSESFYSDLYYKLGENNVKLSAEISLPGVKVAVNSGAPEMTLRTKIEKLLRAADKHGKKVLTVLDEISDNDQVRRFMKIFQEMIGKNLPLYFLGTAIYENIDALRNVKDMTFLYRAPRIELGPLNMVEIAEKYEDIFQIDHSEAVSMSKLTKGYSFAFQALGYVYWNNNGRNQKKIIREYDRLLDDRSYSKMWREMSDTDRQVCRGIAAMDGGRVKDIRERIGMDSKKFNVYRLRLSEKGLIDIETYGRIYFTLPRFSEFVNMISEFYDE